MDRIIEIKVNGNYLTKDNRYAGVQHEANATKLHIEFDEGWDGYAKKVTFWNALGLNPVERTLTTDLLENLAESRFIYLCPIPGEAMTEAGELTFVVDGWANGVRQRSVEDHLTVRPAEFIEQANQPVDPTPTQAEQLQVQIDTMLDDVQEKAASIDAAAIETKSSAELAAISERNAKSSADAALISATTASAYLRDAEQTAQRIENSTETVSALVGDTYAIVSDAEAWASGTRNGIAVGSSDPAFMNNAKYYKEQAKQISGVNFATEEYVDQMVHGYAGDIDCGVF